MWQANLLGVDGLCWWVLVCACPLAWRLGPGVGPVVCVHVLALAPACVPSLLDLGTGGGGHLARRQCLVS